MRFSSSAVLNLQRQSLVDVLRQVRSQELVRQRSSIRTDNLNHCCSLSARISQSKGCFSAPHTIRQQQRNYKPRSSSSSSSVLDRRKQVGSKSGDAIPLSSVSAGVHPASREDRPHAEKRDSPISAQSKATKPPIGGRDQLSPHKIPLDVAASIPRARVTREESPLSFQKKMDEVYSQWHRIHLENPSAITYDLHERVAVDMAYFAERSRLFRTDYSIYHNNRDIAGKRLQEMLDVLKSQAPSITVVKPHRDIVLQCLQVRALSYQGDENAAHQAMLSLLGKDELWISELQEVEKASLTKTNRRKVAPIIQHISDALGSVLQITLDILHGAPEDVQNQTAQKRLDWLLQTAKSYDLNSFLFTNLTFRFNRIVGALKDPLGYVQSRVERLDPSGAQIFVSSICHSLLRIGNLLATYNIYRWAEEADIALNESVSRQLIKSSSERGETEMGSYVVNRCLAQMEKAKLDTSTYRTLVWWTARKGYEDLLMRLLNTSKSPRPERCTRLSFDARLLCYTQKGDVERVVELVESRYDMSIAPGQEAARGLLYPDNIIHARLVQVYLRANVVDQAELMLQRMIQFGYRPSITLIDAILDYYTKIKDVSGVLALFSQMTKSHIRPSLNTYVSLTTLFAARRDIASASFVVSAMQENGIKPDIRIYTSLINAHVESGSWEGAHKIFRWLQQQKDMTLQPLTATHNTILKALVLHSAPVQDVFDFLNLMMSSGLEPSKRTLALVLQSICDAGMMDMAERIFANIERQQGKHAGASRDQGANLWHFTIMINGLLRVGRLDEARKYAIELQTRGFQASGALWAVLAKAYAGRDESGARLQTTYELIQTADFDWTHEYPRAYHPLVHAYSQRGEVDEVQALLQELTDRGADIPLHFWVSNLNAFRQQDNLDGALEMWNVIFAKAMQENKAKDNLALVEASSIEASDAQMRLLKEGREIRSNALCFPLSIMIDILTRHGRYKQVAQEWIRCRKNGFAFDSHNWNHLCCSFIKAGRLRDCLNIIERVLEAAPPVSGSRKGELANIMTVVPDPSSDRFFMPEEAGIFGQVKDQFGTLDGDRAATPVRPPNRRSQNRRKDDFHARVPLHDDFTKTTDGAGNGIDAADGGLPEEGCQEAMDDYERKEQQSGEGMMRAPEKVQKVKSDILKHLESQIHQDNTHSPWYAHFETMNQLTQAMRQIEIAGGQVHLEDGSVTNLRILLQSYPRVQQLVHLFNRKVEEIKEKARSEALRSRNRR